MKTIGAFNVKTHFSKMLALVTQGEEVIITKHGREVARLLPLQESGAQLNTVDEAIAMIRRQREAVTFSWAL